MSIRNGTLMSRTIGGCSSELVSTLATCWSKATISLVMASMSPPASKALQSRAASTSPMPRGGDIGVVGRRRRLSAGRIEKILGAARRLASRAARLDPALLSQIQVHPCNMILTCRPKALGAVLGPDAGEGEQTHSIHGLPDVTLHVTLQPSPTIGQC